MKISIHDVDIKRVKSDGIDNFATVDICLTDKVFGSELTFFVTGRNKKGIDELIKHLQLARDIVEQNPPEEAYWWKNEEGITYGEFLANQKEVGL